ncbi:aminotransferase class I/II-fold pyridoxal phosphate-dependent enzyme [Sphingosinicella rhizophila]|uniref:serine C-palmitoyltransferase n=1 Tax=Sphingosinicella rhizophila TaxID=3050082 RepID=A0ABU3Q4M4_9SPHN|nr:pyridoxal phosphate-dependent aminotransferase family protein [Sphingosinicella sp. GR2756]MDT9598349.1 pyridoxal phosphate-dependent aminotransferase family protein [Sphingosinicella sp. GR2756]
MGRIEPRISGAPVGATIILDGRVYSNFGGSSYLGLSGHPELVDAGVRALIATGGGYQFPRNHGIATRPHLDVEHEAARFFGSEDAFYFAAGYYFGSLAIEATASQFSAIFYDEWSHFSLREAIAASTLPGHAFRHLDAGHLVELLRDKLKAGERPLIVTDGLYSTLGEIAPLADLAALAASHDGRLIVDESHSFGILGETGRGAVEEHRLERESFIHGGSTGKAFGAVGGLIPASTQLVDAFRLTSIGRGAACGLPAAAAMCAASLRHLRQSPALLAGLRQNVRYLKSRLREIGISVDDNVVPIATFSTGSRQGNEAVRSRLLEAGILIFHSHYIGAGDAGMLRCAVFADHSFEQIDTLARLLSETL